jgi:uncharacterized repeat protein (TIGR02543 family)
MKKIRFSLVLISTLLLILPAQAERVEVEKAEKVARSYARTTPRLSSRRDFHHSSTVTKRVSRNRTGLRSAAQPQEEPLYHVFTMNGNGGFIIIAGDDVANPVIGYADQGAFDPANPNLAYWLESLGQEIAQAIESSVTQDADTKAAWIALESGNNISLRTSGDYEDPLLTTNWNQGAPYSNLCPNKWYTGCVATAMAQIMKHHEYPTQGTGSHEYTHPSIGKIQANFGNTTYNWDAMTDTYTSSASNTADSAVALLMFHCGVSVDMNYGSGGSGAISSKVATALKTYFKYDAGITYRQRNYYSSTEWVNLIKAEIKADRPVYYSGYGSGSGSGHAFVCDGYDADDLFHFNWGWGGSSDGYFELSALNPNALGIGGGAGGYNTVQEIITGIKPNNNENNAPPIQMGLSTFTASKSSNSYSLLAGNLTNTGSDTIKTVKVGVLLLNEDNTYSYPKMEERSLNLPPNAYYPSISLFSSSFSLSSLTNGTYKLYPVYIPVAKDTIIIPGEGGNRYIKVVVDGQNVTLTSEFEKPELSFVSLTPVGTLYAGKTGNFEAVITNSGTVDYNSKLRLTVGATEINDPAVIPAGTTKAIKLSSAMPAAGSLTATIYYDPNNAPGNAAAPTQQLGTKTVTVNAVPGGTPTPSFQLITPSSFNSNGDTTLAKNAPNLKVKVSNTGGGVFDGKIRVLVFPEINNEPMIGHFGEANVLIAATKDTTITFNNPIDSLKQGTKYRAQIQYTTGNNSWTSLTPFKFTAGAAVYSSDATLKSIIVKDSATQVVLKEVAITSSTSDPIEVQVPNDVKTVSIIGVATNKRAKFNNVNTTATGSPVCKIEVTSEDGSATKTYWVKIINGIPSPGNGGFIVAEDVTASSLKLKWTKAGDNLTYKVYRSTSNNINTVEDINGKSELHSATNITEYEVTSLSPTTTYYFNVFVTGGNNTRAYKTVSVTTSKAKLSSESEVTITGTAMYGDTLKVTLNLKTNPPGLDDLGTLSYRWGHKDGKDSIGAGDSYTLTSADTSKIITVTVTAANCDSAITAKVGPVAKRTIIITPTGGQKKTYGTAADPVFTYTVSPALVPGDAITGALGRVAGDSAKKYAFTLGSLSAGSKYNLKLYESAPLDSFTIEKAVPSTSLLVYNLAAKKYTGDEQPVTVTAKDTTLSTEDIEVKYFINNRDTVPQKTGTYVVKVNIKNAANYRDTTGIVLGEYTIERANIPADSIAVTPYIGMYDGKKHGITVKDTRNDSEVKFGLRKGAYNFTVDTFTNAGTHTMYYQVIRTDTNYIPYTDSAVVIITKKPLRDTATVTLVKDTVYQGRGGAIRPVVTIVSNLTVTAKDTTVNYSNNINPGKALVTVQATNDGNFSGRIDTSFIIKKATKAAPSAPTKADSTHYSITLHKIEGAEYSIEKANIWSAWQQDSTFAGLEANTEYTFKARYKETDTSYVSVESSTVEISTAEAPTSGISLNVPSTYTFPTATTSTNYTPDTLKVIIKNYGSAATGALTVALSKGDNSEFGFVGLSSSNDIAANSEDSIKVYPKQDLRAGTYTDTIKISGTNISAKITVSFTVDSTYTVNVYGSTGGTITVATPANVNAVKAGDTVTITLTTDEGYELKEVFYYETNSSSNNTLITGNSFQMPAYGVTVAATWEPIKYNITYYNYDPNGGNDKGTYTIKDTIALLKPSNPGYDFGGWFISSDLTGTAVDTIRAGVNGDKGDKTYYAKWTLLTYKVTYDTNGGTMAPSDSTYTVKSSLTLPTATAMSKPGYTFEGWYDDVTKVTVIPVGSTGNKTLKAMWNPVSYKITYEPNNGSSSSITNYTIADSVVLPKPTKSGYDFGGWYNEIALTTQLKDTIPAGTITGDKTFYAKWTAKSYSITYDLNDGIGATNASYTIESDEIVLPDASVMTKANYDFAGWYDNGGLEGERIISIPKGSTENKMFYAKWTPTVYHITYHLNGGSGAATGTYTVHASGWSNGITLPTPTKTNYDFEGWCTEEALTSTPVKALPASTTGDKEYWAKWAPSLAAAKALVESHTFNAPQASTVTDTDLKTWLVTEINALLSGEGISTITTTNTGITVNNFTLATVGNGTNPAGTNGSFSFTAQLTKGASSVTTASKQGVIIAKPYDGYYTITIGTVSGGTVTANKPVAAKDETVTLSNTPDPGYEFVSYSVTNASNIGLAVSEGMFTMPAENVTVTGTFRKNLDQQTVEAALVTVQNGDYSVASAVANTQSTVQAWLVQQISPLLGNSGITVSTVTFSSFISAQNGTVSNPAGTPGSFSFTARLTLGNASATTATITGSITATPYVAPTTYVVTLAPATGGSVTASATSVAPNTTVTLTIAPTAGYELATITAVVSGTSTLVTLSGSGNTRTFVMPANHVTVTATFQKTAAQLALEANQQAVASVKDLIEDAPYNVAQATANTSSAIHDWLEEHINTLLVQTSSTDVTVSNITVVNLTQAVSGTVIGPAGVDGEFTFTASLAKGSGATAATAVTSATKGQIKATAYTPPEAREISIVATNGRVTPSVTTAPAGAQVTLTIAPNTGYELDAIRVNITNSTTAVSLSGTGATRVFTMPAYPVTVTATFKKTQEQVNTETVAQAKTSVEGGTYRIAQATSNSEIGVKTWLSGVLNLLLSGRNAVIQFRAGEADPLTAEVTLTSLMPAVSGTAEKPEGTNGSYRFTVVLSKGDVHVETLTVNGVIVAMPYSATPLKRIELLSMGETRLRIINTGNTETGNLTVSLSGANAGSFMLPYATAGSLTVGGEVDFALTPRSGLSAGTYKTTVTVNGSGLTAVSHEVTYVVAPVGNDASISSTVARVWASGGALYIVATSSGEAQVIGADGRFVKTIPHTVGETVETTLPPGIYIVVAEKTTYKIMIQN